MLARLWLGALVSTLLLAPAAARVLLQTASEIEVGTSNSSAGGTHYGDPFADSPGGRPITEVRVRWGDLVYSIEVLYGNVSGGVHGVPPPPVEPDPAELEFQAQHGLLPYTPPETTTAVLSLEPGELIVGATGRSGRALDKIFFETNRDRKVGGGGMGGDGAWSAAPPAGSDGYLCKLSGLADEFQVGLLTFHWCSQGNASSLELSSSPPASAPPP